MRTVLTGDATLGSGVLGSDGDDEGGPAGSGRGVAGPVHRLRDLDRSGRAWAAVLALALLLAPLLAFAWAAPDWVPAGDPALMGLRALDVGTSRTPLVGQPSSSEQYTDGDMVHHLGASHFYLMALPVRLLGAPMGMLGVSVLIVGSSLLLSAWATFRQLGARAGFLAAVVLGAITFTTGAASLVNPVSSNMAGYPLLCSMVLLWCLACGDGRLLPLTVGVVSFAAQQHLSVVPALAFAAVVTGTGFAVLARREPRSALLRTGAWSAGVAAVAWAPVVVQQLVGTSPNLSNLADFARHDDRPTLGLRSAVEQVVHVLGLPPLLGQHDFDGRWILADPSALTWVSAGVVVVVVAAAGLRLRRTRPRHAMLAAMVGVLALAGLINGSSVPAGIEQNRAVLYHWAFALSFFVVMTLGLAVVDGLGGLAGRSPLRWRPWLGRVGAAAAVVAVAVPSLVNPGLDRQSNTLADAYSPVDRRTVDQLADGIVARRDELGDATLLLARGDDLFVGVAQGLALALTERGVPVRFPVSASGFVDDEWVAQRSTVDSGLVLVVSPYDGSADLATLAPELEGERPIVDIDPGDRIDQEALDELVEQAHAGAPVVIGARGEAALGDMVELQRVYYAMNLPKLAGPEAETLLLGRDVLEFLVDHPLESPELDQGLLERLLDSLPSPTDQSRLRVFLLDREDTLRIGSSDGLR